MGYHHAESRRASNARAAAIRGGLLVLLWAIVGTAGAAEPPWAAYEQPALRQAGDIEAGKKLFWQHEKLRCIACHRIEGQGGQVGPDLSSIGGKFDRAHLIESLLEPSAQIVEGYRATQLRLDGDRVAVGIVRREEADRLELVTSEAKLEQIAIEAIVERQVSKVSMMPTGLWESISPAEFTDLIAYLESRREGMNGTFGGGISGPIALPEGMRVEVVAKNLSGSTAMEVLPDGRVLVCEQTGGLRLVVDDRLLSEPLVTLPVDTTWERGLIGVTCHPRFADNGWIYACWVAREPYPHHRISRWTMDGDAIVADSRVDLLVGDDQRTLGGQVPAGHQGGAMHFGIDGRLYVALGEQTAGLPSQHLDTLQGKLLRLEPDGQIPADNPFVDRARGKYGAIWAMGLRNPFTFAIRREDGLMLINDVGGSFEEINVGRAGANYGWPSVEHGPTGAVGMTGPAHWYPQASIAGGDFVPAESAWPESLRGKYLFGDFVHGQIRAIDPAAPEASTTVLSNLRRPVDLRWDARGWLWILLRNAWVIDGKFQGGTGSLIRVRY